MYIDGGRGHEAMLVHHADTVVFGDAPHAGVGSHRQVEELEVVREGPVGAEPTERRLPHMTVRVNHARHENAASRVDLRRAIRHSELPPDFSNAVVNDEDIAALDHAKRWVNGQHRGVTKYHRAS